jgi:hypothetical protein
MAVGQVYTTVEEGWVRYNAGTSGIEYSNTAGAVASATIDPNSYAVRYIPAYNSNGTTRNDEITIDTYFPHRYATIKCNFTGTKIRILMAWPFLGKYPENVSVYIDSVYSGRLRPPAARNNTTPYQHYWCGFEKLNLANKEHTILMVMEPKSGIFCFAGFDLEQGSVIKASTLNNKNQIRAFTGETDSVVNKLKEGKVITAKYIEINKTTLGYFSDFKLTDSPITKNILSGAGVKANIKDLFEFYQQPGDISMYEITKDSIIFKETRNLKVENGIAEVINPANYKEIFDIDTENATISAIPNDIILKTKNPISYDTVNCFSGLTFNSNKNDIYTKFLLSLDGETYFTFDKDTSTWINADISEIDTVGIENFSSLSYTDLETLLVNSNKVSVIMKIGLAPVELDINDYEINDRILYDVVYTTGPA